MREKLYLVWSLFCVVCFCHMVVCCGEKEANTSKARIGDETVAGDAEIEVAEKFIEHIHDGVKSPDRPVYKVTAEIYDVPALALGENYSSRDQLKSARKIAVLSNLLNSRGETSQKTVPYTFKSNVITSEDARMIDISGKLGGKHFAMTFMTMVKPGFPAFYEMNHHSDQSRMVVIILSAELKPTEK